MEKNNPWTTLSKTIVYDNDWITVEDHKVTNPSGNKGIYGKVHFKNKAIGIIAIDSDNNTWLVGQYRYALNQYSWEIPEGGGPIGIDELESAKRELREETGLVANKWTYLQKLHLSNSVSDEEAHIYMAEEINQGKSNLEETEAGLQVKKLPLKEALDMVNNGEITDSISVAGLLIVARLKGC